MKAKELINKINDIYCFYAAKKGYRQHDDNSVVQGIAIFAPDRNADDQLVMFVPMNAKSWLDVMWRSHTFINTYDGFLKVDYFDFSDDGLNTRRAGVKLSKLLSEFFLTPSDQREPEPKYYLHLGDLAILGKPLYLMKTDSIPFQVTYDHKPDDGGNLEWTQKELDDLKKHYPKLATTIDLIKEPVGDD